MLGYSLIDEKIRNKSIPLTDHNLSVLIRFNNFYLLNLLVDKKYKNRKTWVTQVVEFMGLNL